MQNQDSNSQNSFKIYITNQQGKSNIAKKNNDGDKPRQFRSFKGNKKADLVTR